MIFWPQPRGEKKVKVVRQHIRDIVISNHQAGGQTAHTIINQEPAPVLQRNLSQDQEVRMLAVLQRYPPGKLLVFRFGSKEHSRYSAQIKSVFRRAGWEQETLCVQGKPPRPSKFRVEGVDRLSPALIAASEALSSANLSFNIGTFESNSKADIALDPGILDMTDFQRAADQA